MTTPPSERKNAAMKLLVLALVLANVARADWHDYVVKASCGCWKTTLSFFNADEAAPFTLEKLGERPDGGAILMARFRGEAKMNSAAGKFHFKSLEKTSNLLIVSFNQAGWLVAAKTYPIAEGDAAFSGPFHLEFIDDNRVIAANQSFSYRYQPGKRYLHVLSHETAEFLPGYALKFYGSTDLAIAGAYALPDGDLLIAGAYMGIGLDRSALFLQPGGKSAFALFNFSSDDDPGADVFLARINSAGETKWAKEIWSRFSSVPELALNSFNDGEIELTFDPTSDSAVFEPREAAVTKSGAGTFRGTYSWDGDLLSADIR